MVNVTARTIDFSGNDENTHIKPMSTSGRLWKRRLQLKVTTSVRSRQANGQIHKNYYIFLTAIPKTLHAASPDTRSNLFTIRLHWIFLSFSSDNKAPALALSVLNRSRSFLESLLQLAPAEYLIASKSIGDRSHAFPLCLCSVSKQFRTFT